MITRKVVESMVRDHGRKVTKGNCVVCLMDLRIQNLTDTREGNRWICKDHK
jgi:hypothetical protein